MSDNNRRYDLVTVLDNKMKAVAAYEVYLRDFEQSGDTSARDLFERIRRDDEHHVQELKKAIAEALQEEARQPIVR